MRSDQLKSAYGLRHANTPMANYLNRAGPSRNFRLLEHSVASVSILFTSTVDHRPCDDSPVTPKNEAPLEKEKK